MSKIKVLWGPDGDRTGPWGTPCRRYGPTGFAPKRSRLVPEIDSRGTVGAHEPSIGPLSTRTIRRSTGRSEHRHALPALVALTLNTLRLTDRGALAAPHPGDLRGGGTSASAIDASCSPCASTCSCSVTFGTLPEFVDVAPGVTAGVVSPSARMLTVRPVEEWIPRAHRHAYLDEAASVLGYKPLISG